MITKKENNDMNGYLYNKIEQIKEGKDGELDKIEEIIKKYEELHEYVSLLRFYTIIDLNYDAIEKVTTLDELLIGFDNSLKIIKLNYPVERRETND
jgi:hypothetical protein